MPFLAYGVREAIDGPATDRRPVPTAVTVLGGLGFLLVIGSAPRWWGVAGARVRTRRAATAAAVTLVVAVIGLFPDALPIRVLVWIAVAVTAGSGWAAVRSLLALPAVVGAPAAGARAHLAQPPGMPAAARIAAVSIPGQRSHFRADGLALPPARLPGLCTRPAAGGPAGLVARRADGRGDGRLRRGTRRPGADRW